jgi:hypothetical protein
MFRTHVGEREFRDILLGWQRYLVIPYASDENYESIDRINIHSNTQGSVVLKAREVTYVPSLVWLKNMKEVSHVQIVPHSLTRRHMAHIVARRLAMYNDPAAFDNLVLVELESGPSHC